jgi:hypothetical protein
LVAEELIIEAEQETMMPQQVPVVRASLTRFDDRPRPEVRSRPFSAYCYVVRADGPDREWRQLEGVAL